MARCKVLENEETTQWSFCPSLPAAYLFVVLFGITLCAHIAQAVLHRKGYSWVIIMSALLQFLAYVFRIRSINVPDNEAMYILWFVFILIAPIFTNAYIYMVVGRMIYNFTSSARIMKIKAWRFGLYFVLLEILALLIQTGGAVSASGNDKTREEVLRGVHIYMGGIAFQQLFIFIFAFVITKFHREILRVERTARIRQALLLLYVVYAALFLITVRIIFRLVEYSDGLDTGIPNQEAYQYCLDSLPMLIALALFNIIHPGRVMPGKEGDFPSRKERKLLGKNGSSGVAGGIGLLPTSSSSPPINHDERGG